MKNAPDTDDAGGREALMAFLGFDGLPVIQQCGLVRHGHAPREHFIQKGLWSFHFYHYHGELVLDGTASVFEPLWVSLLPPDVDVEWAFPSNASHYYVHFECPADREGDWPLLIDAGSMAKGLWANLDFIERNHRGQSRACAVRFWDLLWRLALPPVLDQETLPSPVQIATSVIRNSLESPPQVSELARRCGISAGHLNRLFRQVRGMSVQEYIQRARLEQVEMLLTRSELSIAAIARSVGFEDLQAFNKYVRKRLGAAPSKVRALAPVAREPG
jgi:AraC family transcriptional regulator